MSRSIELITPRIVLLYPGSYNDESCCHKGMCGLGILFTPQIESGDDAEIRALVYVDGRQVEEFDPQEFIFYSHTGTLFVPENAGLCRIRIKLQDQDGRCSRYSKYGYFTPKPIEFLV